MVRGKEQVKQVLAVDTDTLFNDGIFYGFQPAGSVDYRSIILANSDFQTHEHTSDVSTFKNIVVCCFIINADTGLLSIYRNDPDNKKRSKYSQSDSQSEYLPSDSPSNSNFLNISDRGMINFGSWSCGYSGHVTNIDASLTDPLLENRISDLEKELILQKAQNGEVQNGESVDGKILRSDLLGYIHPPIPTSKDANLQSAMIQEHFVLVYALQTDASSVIKKDARSNHMIDIYNLREKIHISESESAKGKNHLLFDTWTKQSMHALNKYINDMKRET